MAIDRKLGHIKLVVNSRDSILLVKSMIESVVGLTTHEMIISNASDEEMSDEKSLLAVSVNQSRLGKIDGAAKRTCKTPCQSQGQMRLHSRGGVRLDALSMGR